MTNTLDDGDGMGNTVSEFECSCGMKMERQTHDWISKFKIDNPILRSHIDTICRFSQNVEMADFEKIWGPQTGPSLWTKFQDEFHANFLAFWGYLDVRNQSYVLRRCSDRQRSFLPGRGRGLPLRRRLPEGADVR